MSEPNERFVGLPALAAWTPWGPLELVDSLMERVAIGAAPVRFLLRCLRRCEH